MRFQVDIQTICGEVFQINAKEEWCVWTLKCEIEKLIGTPARLQKLVAVDAFDELSMPLELSDGPLSKYCSSDGAPVKICLVKISKSPEETEWLDRWSSQAPDWLQRMGETVLNTQGLRRAMAGAEYTKLCTPFFGPIRSGVDPSPHFHPTKSSKPPNCSAAKPLKRPILKTSADVLAVIKKTRPSLRSICIHGKTATLQWPQAGGPSLRLPIEQEATWGAVAAAIVEEPRLVLDPLCESEDMTVDDLVELVSPLVAKNRGMYENLPECLMEERTILYNAMERDVELQAEFLRMACRNEVRDWREWQWPKDSRRSRCRWSARCRDCYWCD